MGRIVRVRALAFAVVLGAALPGIARAVTIDDIVALSKARVADSVLVAVIDADRTVFTLTPQQVVELTNAGVSNAVLVKMLGSAREFGPAPLPELPPAIAYEPAPAADSGSVPYGAAYAPATIVVPYYVPISVPSHRVRRDVRGPIVAGGPRHGSPPPTAQTGGFGRFINDGWNSGIGAGGFLNDGWITAPTPQTRTTPPPIRTVPPAREMPPPARVTPPPIR